MSKPGLQDRIDTATYIGAMAAELAAMSRKQGSHVLAYLFEMAAAEAADNVNGLEAERQPRDVAA